MFSIWNKINSLNGSTPEQWFADPNYKWTQNRDVLIDVIGDDGKGNLEVSEVSPLNVVLNNHQVSVLVTDTLDQKLQKLLVKLQEEKEAEVARLAAEEQAKITAQNDQYLRDCNAELATVMAMPDVTPLDEPVVEDTRFKNYKWNFDNGFWNKTALRLTVQKGMISKQEYQAITGEVYQ
jgi:hypothetical protein